MTTLTPELRILTARPEPMTRWWAALLDAQPEALHPRATRLSVQSLRMVIERSEIALDHHREACGVIVISLAPGDAVHTLAAVERLAAIDCHPYRATCHPGYTRLWYRDPNGADVTIDAPRCGPGDVDQEKPLFPDELGPTDVVEALRRGEIP